MSNSKTFDLVRKSKDNDIRLYLILNNEHYFINDGKTKSGFGNSIQLFKNRDSVLSAFSKMAFLFDEIIRLRIVGYHKSKSKDLLYLLNLIPANRKIRTMLDWKIFGPEFTRTMSRLFEVRNDAIHCITLDEVVYNPKKPVSLSSKTGFKQFKTDFERAWKTLLEIYIKEQNKIDFEKLSKDLA